MTEDPSLFVLSFRSFTAILPKTKMQTQTTQMASSLKRIVSNDDVIHPQTKKLKTRDNSKYMKPSQLVEQIFRDENGIPREQTVAAAKAKFISPTKEQIEGYTLELSKAARENDLDKLRELHAAGVALDCCNKFGDSLVNIACRRSHTRIVKFLLEEAKVPVHFADDFGRTPLHDACWTAEPNTEMVEILLKIAPEHALIPDKRGHTPFDYARSTHWNVWLRFLLENRNLLQARSNAT